MNLLTTANAAANLIVVIAVVDMAIRVFGNPEHKIHSHPELFYIRKFVSSLVICGAVLNLITLSTPSWTEIVLNYGFAANYLFSCYYDRLTSSKHSKASREVPRVNAPSRASRPRATKKNSASSGTGRQRATSK
jgi:hypothetical protein